MKQKIFLITLVVLLVSNIFFVLQYISARKEIKKNQNIDTVNKFNEKILSFTRLFIEKVLKSENEIDFETRLQLENAVRAIGDEEILLQWQEFTESSTEEDAQQEVKNLLGLLVSKI